MLKEQNEKKEIFMKDKIRKIEDIKNIVRIQKKIDKRRNIYIDG